MNKKQKLMSIILLLTLAFILIILLLIIINENQTIRNRNLEKLIINKETKSIMINISENQTNPKINNSNIELINVYVNDNKEDETESFENTDEITKGNLIIFISEENYLSDLGYVEIIQMPQNTEEIAIMFYPFNSVNPLEDENLFLEFIDSNFMDRIYFDSEDYVDGDYLLVAGATNSEMSEETPWIDEFRLNFSILN